MLLFSEKDRLGGSFVVTTDITGLKRALVMKYARVLFALVRSTPLSVIDGIMIIHPLFSLFILW
jgi:hypothetical protein